MATFPSPVAVHNGEYVYYTVSVTNSGAPAYCDVGNTRVKFTQPAPNGTPTGSWAYLDTNRYFPSDGSNDATYTYPTYAIVRYQANGNPGVTNLRANVWANGTLYNGFGPETYIEKNIDVTLLWPGIQVTKQANTTAVHRGETIRYTITVTNTSQYNPVLNLAKFSIMDSLLGDISAAFGPSLAKGASESHDFFYTVQPGDPDPLVNTVTVRYRDYTLWEVSDAGQETVDILAEPPPPPPLAQGYELDPGAMNLVVKGLDLFEGFLDYFVVTQWSLASPERDSGYQWTGQINSIITNKGWAVLDDLVTIMHNALDMGGQFSVMFPAPSAQGNTDMGSQRLNAPF